MIKFMIKNAYLNYALLICCLLPKKSLLLTTGQNYFKNCHNKKYQIHFGKLLQIYTMFKCLQRFQGANVLINKHLINF